MANPQADNTPLEEPKDLGFGSIVGGVNERRLLNRDGTFNPRRKGLPFLSSLSFYHYFLTITWTRFFAILFGSYIAANALFALAYLACGPGALVGNMPTESGGAFWRAFFFSVETLATIGYGNIVPTGMAAHFVMTFEAMAGLLVFALMTGVLFARFARPTAALMFSDVAVVAPYRGFHAFMFRVANARSNQLVELEAKMLFSRIEGTVRKYDELKLERHVLSLELDRRASHRRQEPALRNQPRRAQRKRCRVHDSLNRDRRDVFADGARADVVQAGGDQVRPQVREHLQSDRRERHRQHRRAPIERYPSRRE
jgi:hypothetical protein